MTQPHDLFSHTIIHLLKGVLYQEKNADLWNELLNKITAIRDYIAVIGLELFVDESEGYAFVRQKIQTEKDESTLDFPQLVHRRQLSYPVSLLCVLLRKKLIENDTAGNSSRVIISHQQIVDMMQIFLPNRSNEVKTNEQIETCINKLMEFGFLRKLKDQTIHYEIQRIIKAFVDANWLSDFEIKLKEYEDHAKSYAI